MVLLPIPGAPGVAEMAGGAGGAGAPGTKGGDGGAVPKGGAGINGGPVGRTQVQVIVGAQGAGPDVPVHVTVSPIETNPC